VPAEPADLADPTAAAVPAAGSGRALGGGVRAFLRLVMIEHSIFALPFAYLAALTAMWRETGSVHWLQLLLITVAMVSARTVAMGANRILDREFDALNPRTAQRELVTGAMSVRAAGTGTLLALIVFLASAALLNWLCLTLAPVAVGLLVLYSYGKRFTDFPQALLALAQFIAPLGAWIADTGRAGDLVAAAPLALGIAVGTWIGGFDLIYSCQDAEVDRRIGSRSVPARFGVAAALNASIVVHLATVGCFAWFGAAAGLGWLWWAGVAVTAVILCYEHAIVRPHDLSRVNRAFFTANGVIGIALFGFALADLIRLGLSA
jgi:4-hydroxybenzoate polyprenyltransferase